MDKQLRDQIKHDKFVEEVGHTVEYLKGHQDAVRKYGVVAAAVIVLAGAGYAYSGYQAGQRENALRNATLVLDAFVGQQSPTGGQVFKTQADKDAAAIKAFSEVASKYSGSREGLLARYYTGTLLCDQGKVSECEAAFKEVSKGGDANVASLGKLSLATLYQSEGKNSEAEALLRDLVAHPTAVVSKEQAQLSLARAIMKTKPEEARIILNSLQALDRPAVTRSAVALLGEMSGQPQPR